MEGGNGLMSVIDERVVEMRFDNRHFEDNVSNTISSLEKLKSGLNFSGATKGLESIEKASKIDISPLGNAVETVKYKFSALEVMAVTALTNITNSAVNAGKRIVSSLTVDPIKTGFQEYETQINAVQTILANTESKGSTIKDVNAALDELNKYADMTIYNFTEMTRNIGTFTAAGVGLKDSVSSIKGIANLAAISGSTSQQASTAMYQLSQALASGKIALQDWNSVVNAGMGGQVFQDALKRTATVMGTNVDAMIKKYGSFRESLTQGGWLTAEVLTETLNQFAGAYSEADLIQKGYSKSQAAEIVKMAQTATDAATKVKTFTQLFDTLAEAAQSGWTQSWEIIVGDFEEAKEMLTQVSDTISEMINNSSDARNSMLQGWKDLGGRTVLIDAIKNAFDGVMSVVKPVKEAFNEIFPPTTAQQLFNLTNGLKALTSHLKLSDEQSANLKMTFKGMFAVLDICKQAFMAVFNALTPLISGMTGVGGGVLSVTASFGEWLVKLDEVIKKSGVFNIIMGEVSKVLKAAFDFLGNASENVGKAFQKMSSFLSSKINVNGMDIASNVMEKLHQRMEQLSQTAKKVKMAIKEAFDNIGNSITGSSVMSNLEGFTGLFASMWTVIRNVASQIGKACKSIGTAIGDAFNTANFDNIFDLINGGLMSGLLIGLKSVVNGFGDAFEEIGGFTEGVTETLDAVRGCFEAYQSNLKSKTLLNIAAAIAILAGSIVVISLIDSAKLTASLAAISALFAELLLSMTIFSKLSGGMKGVTKTVTAMIGISTAILMLAGALKVVSSIDTDSMVTGLVGLTGLTAIVITTAKVLSSGQGKIMKGTASLILFAEAIKVLARVCKDLGQMSWESMVKGLTGIGVLMAEVSVFLNTAKFSKRATTTALGMVIMSEAIKVLASACQNFAVTSWEGIAKGLVAVGALLVEIALFTKVTGNTKHVVSTGASMVLLATSIKILSQALGTFAGMNWDTLGRGLVGMAGALTAVTISMNLLPKGMVTKGLGLIAVAQALTVLSDSMVKMGGMSWDEIARGLTVLGGSLLILALGLNGMNNTLPGSAALLVASGALAILSPVLQSLGGMSWEEIGKGLLTLAGAFTVIGVAGLVLTPLVPTIVALAGSFALIGAAVLGIGAGLMAAGVGLGALATGLLALGGAGTAAATAIVASLAIIIAGIAELIPTVVAKLGEGLIELLKVIIAAAPTICEAVVVIVSSVVDAIVKCAPKIMDAVAVLITALMQTIVKYMPQIITLGVQIITEFLDGIAQNIGKVTISAINVAVAFIEGIASKIGAIIQAGIDLVIAFINGVADGLNNNVDRLVAAMQNLILAVVNAGIKVIGGAINTYIQAGIKIIVALFNGIKGKIGTGIKIAGEVITKIKDAFLGKVSDFIEIGGHVMSGFIDGIKAKIGDAIAAVQKMGNDVVQSAKDTFGIHSPSRVFRNEVGKQLGAGMALGVKDSTSKVTKATKSMSEKAIEAAKKQFDGFKEWLSDKKYFNELTTEDELYAWEQAQKKYSKYADLRKECDKEIYRLKNELEEQQFNNSKNWISERKQYDQLTTEQELKAWERLQKKYKEGTDKRKECDKEVYELRKKLEDESFSNSKEYISNEKFYDRMTLKRELEAWKVIQKRYEEGTDKRKEADKEVYTLEKQFNEKAREFEEKRVSINKDYQDKRVKMEQEYADKVKSINDKLAQDIQSAQDQYDSAVKSRADSIYGSYSLFDAVKDGEDVDASTLMDNLEGQLDNLESWQRNLKQLAGKGVGDEFMDEISKMGPSALKQIEALNSMSSSKLDKYVDMWTRKHELATEQAEVELDNMRIETNAKIAKLKEDASIELDSYREMWNEQMVELKNNTMTQLEELKTNWTSTVGSITDVLPNGKALFDGYSDTGKEAMNGMNTGVVEKGKDVITSVKTVSDTAVQTVKETTNEYQVVGNMIVDGLVQGINDNRYKIIAAISQMAESVITTIRQKLDIHSPSRVMTSLGGFAAIGFADGLCSHAIDAENAGKKVADSAKTGLSNAISNLSSMINGDMNLQPTIRPVLDLSDVETGVGTIDAMFAKQQALSISASMSEDMNSKYGQNSNNGDTIVQFTQNNYSPKALSRIDIYRQTRNQLSAMKGVTR